jgi:hypothetical protein
MIISAPVVPVAGQKNVLFPNYSPDILWLSAQLRLVDFNEAPTTEYVADGG